MSVIVIKMSNGSEVIANLVNETSTHLIVDRPRMISVSQDQMGNMQGAMMAYIISDSDRKDIPLSLRHVVTFFDASKDLSDEYLQMTSGILLG